MAAEINKGPTRLYPEKKKKEKKKKEKKRKSILKVRFSGISFLQII
jgi:hypothetical protein